MDTIDAAAWNASVSGYSNHGGGTASGYTSTYNVDFDEKNNVYSQSYFGWTVEKWKYSAELPTIELTITSVEKSIDLLPTEFSLEQNYPNPFNPATTIQFSIVENSSVTLAVYSLTGELLQKLLDSEELGAGVYEVNFDASKFASGTYIYTLRDGNQTISKKMLLIK